LTLPFLTLLGFISIPFGAIKSRFINIRE